MYGTRMNATAPGRNAPALPPPEHRLSVAEAAIEAHVHRRTIEKWLTNGTITRYRLPNGYHVCVDRREVLAYAATPRGGGVRKR